MTPTCIQKDINLNDGSVIKYYFARDSHGSQTENYTHIGLDGKHTGFYKTDHGKSAKLVALLKEAI